DGNGNRNQTTYPNGFQVATTFTSKGELHTVKNAQNSSEVFWETRGYDNGAHLDRFRLLDGSGRATTLTFNNDNGRLERIYTPSVQDLRYQYDNIGNLTQRKNQLTGATENITYDNLNRLAVADFVNGPTLVHAYDEVGNLTSRSDVGCYDYPSGSTRKHAVTRIKDAQGNTIRSFSYDANGNMLTNGGTTISYTSFNKPLEINSGSKKLVFEYGSDRKRKKQKTYVGSTLTETRYYVNDLLEVYVNHATGVTTEKSMVKAHGKVRAIRETITGNATPNWYTLRYDNLGSVENVRSGAQNAPLIRKLDYDVWGRNRDHANGSTSSTPAHEVGNYGFTAHEHLGVDNFIHMGGRLYDPSIGRVMSPDPVVADPYNMQHYNRYSYAVNQPLVYTDPSGYTSESGGGFLGGVADAIGGAVDAVAGIFGGFFGGPSTAPESAGPTSAPAPTSRPTAAPAASPAPTSRPTSPFAPATSPAPTSRPVRAGTYATPTQYAINPKDNYYNAAREAALATAGGKVVKGVVAATRGDLVTSLAATGVVAGVVPEAKDLG
ncbi:MAG: RHS repeat-associated core domain-containing protein, partial [Bacteroidota bacterium]